MESQQLVSEKDQGQDDSPIDYGEDMMKTDWRNTGDQSSEISVLDGENTDTQFVEITPPATIQKLRIRNCTPRDAKLQEMRVQQLFDDVSMAPNLLIQLSNRFLDTLEDLL